MNMHLSIWTNIKYIMMCWILVNCGNKFVSNLFPDLTPPPLLANKKYWDIIARVSEKANPVIVPYIPVVSITCDPVYISIQQLAVQKQLSVYYQGNDRLRIIIISNNTYWYSACLWSNSKPSYPNRKKLNVTKTSSTILLTVRWNNTSYIIQYQY